MFQVYGLMDGTYVPVKRPTLNSQDVFLFFYFLHLSAWKSISNVSITTKSNSITLWVEEKTKNHARLLIKGKVGNSDFKLEEVSFLWYTCFALHNICAIKDFSIDSNFVAL